MGKFVFISCYVVGYGFFREDWGVMELLFLFLFVERWDKIIVVWSDFVVFFCVGGLFFYCGVVDGIVVDDI